MDLNDEIFGRVQESERETVLAIYRAMVGTPGCTWSAEYPGEEDFDSDMEKGALYCMSRSGLCTRKKYKLCRGQKMLGQQKGEDYA